MRVCETRRRRTHLNISALERALVIRALGVRIAKRILARAVSHAGRELTVVHVGLALDDRCGAAERERETEIGCVKGPQKSDGNNWV